MATGLTAGFTNNINVIQVRVNGAHSHRYTDRPLDVDNDGTDDYAARTVVSEVTETDGGVHKDNDVSEFSEGIE